MKKMKKLFAVLLTLAMVLGMSMTSFAADPGSDKVYGTADDTGTITVKGIEQEDGISVKAYPIIEAQYNQTTKTFIGYKSKYAVNGISSNLITENVSLSAAQLTAYTNAVKDASAEGKDLSLDSNENYSLSGLAVGSYLVLVENTESHSYNPMVVSVYYENKNGSTQLKEGTLDISDGVATAKKSDEPGLDKEITNATNTTSNQKGNSVEVGDTVNYKVTVNPIPSYTGAHPVLNVVDTLDNGLAFATGENTPVVNSTLVKDTHYTLDIANQTMTVNFVVNDAYTLNKYAGAAVTIEYSATVTSSAVVWDDVNKNTATLNYTKDSKVTGKDDSTTTTTYTYTFDIDGSASGTENVLVKTKKVGTKEVPLEGAIFGLYRSGDGVTAETVSKASANDAYKKATSTKEGQLAFSQLKEGTYYLKELTAPDGYSVNTHVYTIVIAATYNTNGTLNNWTITVDNTKKSTFTSKTTADGSSTATVNSTGI